MTIHDWLLVAAIVAPFLLLCLLAAWYGGSMYQRGYRQCEMDHQHTHPADQHTNLMYCTTVPMQAYSGEKHHG